MTPHRNERIEKLFRDAAGLNPQERVAFLDHECADDPSLRLEIEERLRVNSLLETRSDTLTGQTIGSYTVKALIGSGGMGDVYRAHDQRLDRNVAIKVLSAELAGTREFHARFQREARVLASLNHPNIAAVFGLEESVGRHFLVMEFIDGETLATRLTRGRLSFDEVVRYGIQIASALAAAHSAGIVHRDLKPANIMITKSGAKVLDFGLAKSTGAETLTASHVVMGTPAYMAPEQREGKPTDARTDIYALGLILYEMVAGERHKPNQSPSWNALPAQMAHLIRQCLSHDPAERWQSALDVKTALELVTLTPVSADGVPSKALRRQFPFGLVAAVLAAVIIAAAAGYSLRTLPVQPAKFSITPPEGTAFLHVSQGGPPALSPDGSKIAFVAEGSKGRLLWVCSLDGLTTRPLAVNENATNPFWAPDGRWIGFFSINGLEKIDSETGQAQTIASQVNPISKNGTWNAKEQILYTIISTNLLGVTQASGGTQPNPATERNIELLDENHVAPFFLPDGQRYLLGVRGGPELDWSVWLGTLGSNERTLILKDVRKAEYASPRLGRPGYIVYARDRNLMAQPFDINTGSLSGEAALIAGDIAGSVDFTVSPAGVLAYRTDPPPQHDMVWIDRNGKEVGTIGDHPGDLSTGLRLSPDGRRVAFTRRERETQDIWIHDLARNETSRLTLNGGRSPIWSPDGSQIAFVRGDSIYRILTSGGGTDTLVWRGPHLISVNDWSGDGRYLLLTKWDEKGTRQTWMLTEPTAEAGKNEPVLLSTGIHSQFVPSVGPPRWLVYDDRGQSNIRSLPDELSLTRQLSTDGGNGVRSRRDGREVYFRSGRSFVAVELNFGPPFRAGAPRALFPIPQPILVGQGQYAQGYDVTGDGSRFIATLPAPETPATTITVLKDWQAILTK